MALRRQELDSAARKLRSTKLLSNEFKTFSIHEHESVLAELNRNKGYGLDPLELLIRMEEAADRLWEDNPQWVVDRYTFIRDERNRRIETL